MNGYKAFYKGKQVDVYAETSFKAQEKAAEEFKKNLAPRARKSFKSYDITVVLCEKDGEQVVHSTSSI